MSMDTYPAQDIGFFVNAEVASYILLSADKANNQVPGAIKELLESGDFGRLAKAGELPDGYSYPSLAYEGHKCIEDAGNYFSSFAGSIKTLFPEKAQNPIEENFDDDWVVYIPAKKEPDLFKAAYASPEELLQEFVNVFAEAKIELPEGFDWWANIITIDGTDFC